MTDDQYARDIAEIGQLLARIAFTADRAEDLDDYLDLMVADIEFVFGENREAGTPAARYQGRDAVRDGARARREAGVQGPGTHTMHVVSSVIVERTGSDMASAWAYWRYYTDTHQAPRLNSMGTYENELRRVDGAWKLSRRVVHID